MATVEVALRGRVHTMRASNGAVATAATTAAPPPHLNPLLADALLEFLEAAVHTVLHARGLYPQEVFERRRIYGSCLCPRARHPGVCAYVASALAALRAPLVRGALQEVAVVMLSGDPEAAGGGGSEGGSVRGQQPPRALEKVSFVLHRAVAAAAPTAAAEQALPDAAALEAAFAAALVKLQHLPQAPSLTASAGGAGGAAAGAPTPLPRGATFEIVGLAASRDGVDRSALMEEDVLDAGPEALLLPKAQGERSAVVAGWPLKTIRLLDGSGGGGGGAAATLTILVEKAADRRRVC